MNIAGGAYQHLTPNVAKEQSGFVLHCTFFHGMLACGIGVPGPIGDR